jgi:tetratricopeptide (TPR) repeat protein
MPENEFDGFQQGGGSDGGLAWEKAKIQSRPTIQIDTNVDLNRLGAFGSGKIKVPSVVGHLPTPEGGLQTKMDLGQLGEGVRKIKAKEKSDQVRALLDEAERMIQRREYRKAIPPLDEALGIEPASSQVLLIKAYALFGLEDFVGAICELHKARNNSTDSDTLVLTVFLEGACVRALTERIETKLAQLVQSGKTTEALSYLDTQIRTFPENPVLIYHRCNLLLLLSRAGESKRAAIEAMNRIPTAARMFSGLLAEIAVAESARFLEAARGALRHDNPAGALEQLGHCCNVMAGNEQFEAIRSYADSLVPRSFLSSVLRKNRPLPLDELTLQRLLLWLLAEEIAAGVKALDAKDNQRAMQIFEDSNRIDPRCNVVSYLQAVAIVKEFEKLLVAKTPLDLVEWVGMMRKAEMFLGWAAKDSGMLDQCRALSAVVQQYSTELAKVVQTRQRREAESKPINELFSEFNSFMKVLKIHSMADLDKAEKKLKDMRAAAKGLLCRTQDSKGQEHIRKLISVIDRHLEEAAKARRR